ncbi:MAG TPA: DUF5640 domain-containing protein [Thermodesulfobacteriota bacterium]|nr:DUF5640 domain-containing protein [Thermodesulfobacteriota bacterium]
MRGVLTLAALLIALSIAVSGCDAIKRLFNPFAGKWRAGMIELEFENDRTFKFVLGSTISVNLSGDYSYDDKTLVLKFEKGSEVNFSYEFSGDKKTLTLIPETDFDYIKTRLDFTKE